MEFLITKATSFVLIYFEILNIFQSGVEEPLTLQSADQIVSILHSTLDQQNASSSLANSVRDIIGKMDFSQIIA